MTCFDPIQQVLAQPMVRRKLSGSVDELQSHSQGHSEIQRTFHTRFDNLPSTHNILPQDIMTYQGVLGFTAEVTG